MKISNSFKNIVLLILLISFTVFCTIVAKKESSNKMKKAQIQDVQDDNLQSILKSNYTQFVKDLGDNIKDPKFRAAIRSLSSKNHVSSKNFTVDVKKLLPTQNEVDVDKSLRFPLRNNVSARNYLFCKDPIKILGVSIVTSADGKYVIDGHHRWSQVYSINPNCKMASLDLTDVTDPINALKSTQLGIAAGNDREGNDITTIPVAIVEGKNLLKISEGDLKAYVNNTITEDVLAVFTEFNSNLKTNSDVADYIWGNVKMMQTNNQPIPGAPGRGIMPQTDMAPNWVNNTVNTDIVLNKNLFLRTTSAGFTGYNLLNAFVLFLVIALF